MLGVRPCEWGKGESEVGTKNDETVCNYTKHNLGAQNMFRVNQ